MKSIALGLSLLIATTSFGTTIKSDSPEVSIEKRTKRQGKRMERRNGNQLFSKRRLQVLSEKEQKEVQELIANYKKTAEKRTNEIKIQELEVEQLLLAEKRDLGKINQTLDKLGELKAEHKFAFLSERHKIISKYPALKEGKNKAKEKLKKRVEFRKKIAPIELEITNTREALATALLSDDFDDDKIKSLVQKVSSLKTKIEKIRIEMGIKNRRGWRHDRKGSGRKHGKHKNRHAR